MTATTAIASPVPIQRRSPVSPRAMRNIRAMHLLEWVAGRFNQAGIPVMALKGAALYLTIYRRPGRREMTDLDLLIRPEDADRAMKVLEDLGCHRGETPFREDFFPKYYYEVQYRIGSMCPIAIDLHVRPFRLLRLARTVPEDAFWKRATAVTIGHATVLVPSDDDMLVHLAAHSAIHGNQLEKWLEDIHAWIAARGRDLDWDRFLATTGAWRLAAAVRSGIERTEQRFGSTLPLELRRCLAAMPVNWRDRLALWHAPRDKEYLWRSFLVSAVTTPGLCFVLGCLRDVLVPDRTYLDEWSVRHHCRWPAAAVVLRYLWPVVGRLPWIGRRSCKVEVRQSGIHGLGVFATMDIRPGEVIARYRGRPVDRDGTYVSTYRDASGREVRHEITGPLKYLNHSCRPNAELRPFRVRALVPIRAGQEITMNYGSEACECDREARRFDSGRTP